MYVEFDERHSCRFCVHSKPFGTEFIRCAGMGHIDALRGVREVIMSAYDSHCGNYEPETSKLAEEGLMLEDGEYYLVETGTAGMGRDEYNGVRAGRDYPVTMV
jgi:hypothetical protein